MIWIWIILTFLFITIFFFIIWNTWDDAKSEYIDRLASEVFETPGTKVQAPKIEMPSHSNAEKPKKMTKKKKAKIKRIEAEG